MDKLEYVTERSRTPEETGSIHEELSDASNQKRPKRKRSKKRRKSGGSGAFAQISPSMYDSHASEEGREESENDGQSAGQQADDRRTPEDTGSIREELRDASNQDGTKRNRSKERRKSGIGEASAQIFPSMDDALAPKEGREEGENDGQSAGRQATGLKQDTPLPQEDCKAQFYKQYRNVADEYDKDFLKKHKDNLNTTLIFAGLFSAVTSAFIVMVDSRLQPDRGSETTALLRVLIYKTDNTTFKDDVPSLPPQWTGPPPAMVDVEAILYMSLVASLFSAFLAMLGKQWLNRYASTDLRGSVIERGQNRQRKLDGVDTWYFDAVMESLPLMLQAALLLLGCALSRYLWEVDVTVASVVIGVTSFGVVLYLFILVAGVVSEVCPYQTPGSYFIRHLVQHVPSASALGDAISGLDILETAHAVAAPLSHRLFDDDTIQPYVASALFIALVFPTAIYRIGRATTRVSSQVLVGACGLFCRACCWLQREQIVEEQVAMLDSRCILWTSQTSLDKPVHHSIVRYLATIPKLHNFDPTLVTLCYNVFVGCVSITDGKVVIVEGLDEPAAASIRCLFRTFHHLMATDPTSSVLCNLFLCYQTNFPHRVVSTVLPFYATMMTIHLLVDRGKNLYEVSWDNSSPSIPDHVAITQDLVKAAMVEYKQRSKVSRWILRFVLHSLSMDPPLPASAVADCLTIVAIDLDCDISDITFLDESAHVERVSDLIVQKLKTIAEDPHRKSILLKRKAISALFPYAIHLECVGRQVESNAITHLFRDSEIPWRRIEPYVKRWFKKSATPSLNQALIHMLPLVYWNNNSDDNKTMVKKWAEVVSKIPVTEEVCRSAVAVMLLIARGASLLPLIPDNIWAWWKKRPSLPPFLGMQLLTTDTDIFIHLLQFDIEILKSYLLVLWSEWHCVYCDDVTKALLCEIFGGIGMQGHKEDLIERLDHVLGQLDRGLEYIQQQQPRVSDLDLQMRGLEYRELKDALEEVHGE